ncbi:MAG: VOC family protein [Sphingomonadales bacterium]
MVEAGADIIKRTTLIVGDAEAAARFHEAVLGMTRVMDTPFTLSGRALAAGQAGDVTRLIIMKCADDAIGMLGLLQWVTPPLDLPAETPRRIPFGMPIFVVAAVDAAATLARARAHGGHVHAEAEPWQVTGFSGQVQQMVGGSFFDPDGYFFEVNQRVG